VSRVDHIVKRRMQSARPKRRRDIVTQWNGYRFVHESYTSTQHKQGDQWWRAKYADLVDRRVSTKHGVTTYKPRDRAAEQSRPAPRQTLRQVIAKIKSDPRPESMSRQVHRELQRKAIEYARRTYAAAGV